MDIDSRDTVSGKRSFVDTLRGRLSDGGLASSLSLPTASTPPVTVTARPGALTLPRGLPGQQLEMPSPLGGTWPLKLPPDGPSRVCSQPTMSEQPPVRRVMISSTALDLPEHRRHARDACERMSMLPLVMEQMPASPADALTLSRRYVDQADFYLGIFAFRYGFVPEGQEKSITELEYDRADRAGHPHVHLHRARQAPGLFR